MRSDTLACMAKEELSPTPIPVAPRAPNTRKSRLDERINLINDAASSVEPNGDSIDAGLAKLETALRRTLPFVPFNYKNKFGQRRVAFWWDGWRIQVAKPIDPPPPSTIEVHNAFEGIVEDALQTVREHT